MTDWFLDQRMAWIAESLKIFGFINRAHIIQKFGISTAQAALDMREFNRRHPGAMHYDAKRKCYVKGRGRK